MKRICCINVKLRGTWCHHWPKLRVLLNNHIYFDGDVVNDVNVEFVAPVDHHNSLIIQHYNKNFGQNGQWDTLSENGVIVQDRALQLLSLTLDEVDISKYIFDHCPLVTDTDMSVHTDYYGFNGSVTIDFSSPVYEWIIDTIVRSRSKKMSDLTQAIETSHGNLFDYRQDLIELDELEKILDQNAHLFDKSSQV